MLSCADSGSWTPGQAYPAVERRKRLALLCWPASVGNPATKRERTREVSRPSVPDSRRAGGSGTVGLAVEYTGDSEGSERASFGVGGSQAVPARLLPASLYQSATGNGNNTTPDLDRDVLFFFLGGEMQERRTTNLVALFDPGLDR